MVLGSALILIMDNLCHYFVIEFSQYHISNVLRPFKESAG